MNNIANLNLGKMICSPLCFFNELSVSNTSDRWDILRAFLNRAEARAERLIERDNGMLVLASVPGRPNSGGIYLLDNKNRAVIWIRFEKRDEDFSGAEFDWVRQLKLVCSIFADFVAECLGFLHPRK